MDKLKIFRKLEKLNQGVYHGSWAVWKGTERDSVGDMSILDDIPKHKNIFGKLKPEVLMVALNPSGTEKRRSTEVDKKNPWKNFHSRANFDCCIAKAFKGTPYYGAYMTDFIKIALGPDTNKAKDAYDRLPKARKKENVEKFKAELDAIGADNIKVIIALGKTTTMKYLQQAIKEMGERYKKIKLVGVWHYGYVRRLGKGGDKKYVAKVHEQLGLKK
jgi:hypothetical protein